MATLLWECESETMELLHISRHLCLWEKKKKTSVHWDEDSLDLVSGRILLNSISEHPQAPQTPTPPILKK
ncbi:hypothetical protein EPR50_G00024500 [Scomber scombrus]|uniref:Uncharacterized protein n=1 Tax=Scomber scombrus TaxID=13677 RepID=A0AAV1NVC7_SCOSC